MGSATLATEKSDMMLLISMQCVETIKLKFDEYLQKV